MNFNYEVIKDLIIEKDPTVNRKNIIFKNVYLQNNEYIMAPYRELIWSNNLQISILVKVSLSVDEYELRLKEKLRDNKLDELGI